MLVYNYTRPSESPLTSLFVLINWKHQEDLCI